MEPVERQVQVINFKEFWMVVCVSLPLSVAVLLLIIDAWCPQLSKIHRLNTPGTISESSCVCVVCVCVCVCVRACVLVFPEGTRM